MLDIFLANLKLTIWPKKAIKFHINRIFFFYIKNITCVSIMKSLFIGNSFISNVSAFKFASCSIIENWQKKKIKKKKKSIKFHTGFFCIYKYILNLYLHFENQNLSCSINNLNIPIVNVQAWFHTISVSSHCLQGSWYKILILWCRPGSLFNKPTSL